MARIPSIRRLTSEDFRDQASWIGKLFAPVNDFMSSVIVALNKGLTFDENFNAQIKTLEFIKEATSFPMSFACTLTMRPVGLWVLKAENIAGTPDTLTTAIWVDWKYDNGTVTISNISGLTNAKKYRISVIIVAG